MKKRNESRWAVYKVSSSLPSSRARFIRWLLENFSNFKTTFFVYNKCSIKEQKTEVQHVTAKWFASWKRYLKVRSLISKRWRSRNFQNLKWIFCILYWVSSKMYTSQRYFVWHTSVWNESNFHRKSRVPDFIQQNSL